MSEFEGLYPTLTSLGLTSDHLLAVAEDSDHGSDIEALELPVSSITNQLILELYNFMNRNSACTFYVLWCWMSSLFLVQCKKEDFPTIKSIRQSILRLSAKLHSLKKMPSSSEKVATITKFLTQPYTLPRIFISRGRVVVSSETSEESTCSSCAKTKCFMEKSKQRVYAARRNGQKRVKRRDDIIKQQGMQIKEDKDVIIRLQKQATDSVEQVSTLKAKVDRLRYRASYWKSKFIESSSDGCDEVAELERDYQQKQKTLVEEIRQLECDNLELRDKVDEVISDEIVTFEGGKYTNDIRACCFELLSLNVSVNNVKSVIESVLTNITHKKVKRLPKKTAVCQMMLECLTIAQAQIGEQLSSDDGEYYTLQTDGTTKHGHHFCTIDVATSCETYCLGLRHIFSGSAQTTLDTFREILDDLDVIRHEIGELSVSSKIVYKLKNTMSDRHAAEKLFSTLLSDYRASILPDIVDGWERMTNSEREQLTRMNNFFCGLHFLIALADAAEETLKLWEAANNEEDVSPYVRSSGTQRLIRTACKAFHHRGSEQSGCSTHFRTYLRQKGIVKLPLASFVGNRFNILFYDAAGVFFLKAHMMEYLSNYHGASLNLLLQAVLKDLKSSLHIAGCKALGIIDKLVTGPFWRSLQASTVSILKMSDVYTNMRDRFEKWSEDAQCVLDNEAILFPETTSFQDEVMDLLYTEVDNDQLVLELLQLLFKSFALTIERLMPDHLPGGQFHDLSDPVIVSETASVPVTNIVPERDFANLDRFMLQKPNATYIALESMILFSQNKTSVWLREKSEDEKERLLHAARKLSKVHKQNFRKRTEEIKAKRLELLLRRERELSRKREKELKDKEELTLKVQKYGLWTTNSEVEQQLSKIKTKKLKMDALKTQINFRRKVLNQQKEKHLFQFSHNHRLLTIEEVCSNLSQLLLPASTHSVPEYCDIERDPELLLYRRVKHLFNVDGASVWYSGTVISYDTVTKQFRIAYDNEDEVFSFSLLDDLKCGDLKIF